MANAIGEKAIRFRELHESGLFVLPNPWSRGTAKILTDLGSQALATTSAGLAFTLGLRDGEGAVGADVSLEHAREIVESTSLPVSADLEDGFGASPDAVADTIRRAAEVGLVGASIEDATYDAENPLYDFGLAVERIVAAVEAARSLSFPFTLTARTEGFIRGRPDFDETLNRLSAFEEAGADVLFAPGVSDLERIQEICRSLHKPVNVLVGTGPAPYALDALRDVGVRRVSTGSSLARAAFGGLLAAANELAQDGTATYAADQMTVSEWNRLFEGDGP